jgi:hypothetical protein
MSRPKPTILLDSTDPDTYKSEQVLQADGIYAVFLEIIQDQSTARFRLVIADTLLILLKS